MYIIEKLFVCKQWFIAYRKRQSFNMPLSMDGFIIIRPPAGRFYADPFILDHEGKSYIFFEDYLFKTRKGIISCIEINGQGEFSKPRAVLERNYHLAYPFLVTFGQKIYMIPDTSANNTIEIYEAVDFPYQWRPKQVLLSGLRASDSTLFEYNDKWWLFTNVMSSFEQTGKGQLHVFFADSLFAKWHPHPCNPVNCDAKTARPAGNIFMHEGKIIRPAQDCEVKYGAALIVNEIICLTETDYLERLVSRNEPDWTENNLGLHTYNFSLQWEVIDGLNNMTDILKPIRWLVSIGYRLRF